MSLRHLALILLAAAAVLYLGVLQPKTRTLGALRDEYRQVRDGRTVRLVRLAAIERSERERERAVMRLARACAPSLPAIRRHVLARFAGLGVSDLRLEVVAAPAPAFAAVNVQAEGEFLNLVALASRLAHPDTGLALQSVSFARSRGNERVRLKLAAQTVMARP